MDLAEARLSWMVGESEFSLDADPFLEDVDCGSSDPRCEEDSDEGESVWERYSGSDGFHERRCLTVFIWIVCGGVGCCYYQTVW